MSGDACRNFERVAKALADGEVPPAAAALFEAHRDACGSCRAFADDLAAISSRLRRVADEGAPEPRTALLRSRFEASSRERVRIVRTLRRVAAAAAVVLLSASMLVWWRGSPRGPATAGDAASAQRDDVMQVVLSDAAWSDDYWEDGN